VGLTFRANPSGLRVDIASDDVSKPTPFTATAVVGHVMTISAPSPQLFGSKTYYFSAWSDGGAAAHTIVAPRTATTYTATYRKR
jgi:hypothetical protein